MHQTDSEQATGVVLADVGGTNVRFAVLMGDVLGLIEHLAVRDYKHFGDALDAFLRRQTQRAAIRGAVFAVAGVVKGERCELTNSAWIVDAAELRGRFGLTAIDIVNDFAAIAWSLPRLAGNDLRLVGGGAPLRDAPMVVLGPGTGLGVAAYVPRADGAFVLHSEGGHSTAPSGSPREDAIVDNLRRRFGHVSAERVLSGYGLENLYRAIAEIDSVSVPERNAAEITQAAMTGRCPTSRAALDTFCAMLGDVAGNFALGFGAQGGVFIAGGIIPRVSDELPRSQFRARFEAKGRLSGYLKPIPVYLILQDDPAFIGLRSLAARLARKV
ncbi:MAG: glucokinase [Rhizobiales bacterium]|nr:glucokinase [Hyphomicrobiales bacterium]